MLPSVDHIGDGKGPADFKICAWRTNDAKNDLSYDEFLELCRKVIAAANMTRKSGESSKLDGLFEHYEKDRNMKNHKASRDRDCMIRIKGGP